MPTDIPTLAWLDFSDAERRKMLDVVSLFNVSDTRDELGIGSIRDTISDLLFPGTSTIMTRARYFLFVPWIYARRERIIRDAGRHTARTTVAALSRSEEIVLVNLLEAGGESQGVIGIEARGKLKRLPSDIYWNGLERWGIRRFTGGIDNLNRSLQRYDSSRLQSVYDDDYEPVGDVPAGNWHPALPVVPHNFLYDRITFDLTHEEAVFLKERILATCPGALLAHLVSHGESVDSSSAIPFPWEHPEFADIPHHNQTELGHAAMFSLLIHGAALLYNLLMSEEVRHAEWTEDYRSRLSDWGAAIDEDRATFGRWRLDEFWGVIDKRTSGRIASRTVLFVEAWVGLIRGASGASGIADNAQARQLIRRREHQLKGGRARLGNPTRLQWWHGEAGTAIQDYRWSTVRTMIDEIRRGLERPVQRA